MQIALFYNNSVVFCQKPFVDVLEAVGGLGIENHHVRGDASAKLQGFARTPLALLLLLAFALPVGFEEDTLMFC